MNITSTQNEFYKVKDVPVKVIKSRFGSKAFYYLSGKPKIFPLEKVWNEGLKITKNEFIILCSMLSSKMKMA
jgi:hypothetical protein